MLIHKKRQSIFFSVCLGELSTLLQRQLVTVILYYPWLTGKRTDSILENVLLKYSWKKKQLGWFFGTYNKLGDNEKHIQ